LLHRCKQPGKPDGQTKRKASHFKFFCRKSTPSGKVLRKHRLHLLNKVHLLNFHHHLKVKSKRPIVEVGPADCAPMCIRNLRLVMGEAVGASVVI